MEVSSAVPGALPWVAVPEEVSVVHYYLAADPEGVCLALRKGACSQEEPFGVFLPDLAVPLHHSEGYKGLSGVASDLPVLR